MSHKNTNKHNFLSANRMARKWEDQKIQVKFVDSVSFMTSSLSGLTDNLASLHKGKFKDCKSSLDYMAAKDGLLSFNYADCNKTYDKKFDEDISKRFENIHQFFDGDINKFCLILQKYVYPLWLAQKDSVKCHCPQRKNSTAT